MEWNGQEKGTKWTKRRNCYNTESKAPPASLTLMSPVGYVMLWCQPSIIVVGMLLWLAERLVIMTKVCNASSAPSLPYKPSHRYTWRIRNNGVHEDPCKIINRCVVLTGIVYVTWQKRREVGLAGVNCDEKSSFISSFLKCTRLEGGPLRNNTIETSITPSS